MPVGESEKYACHRRPTKLHRAFSIFVLNKKNQLLVHRRALSKKTWPGFWTNTCCSHPRVGETLDQAVHRRLKEELGFNCDLRHLFHFEYKVDYDSEWGENELDHVFVGSYDGPVEPNTEEVDDYKFVDLSEIKREFERHPEKYTPWFKICFNQFLESIKK